MPLRCKCPKSALVCCLPAPDGAEFVPSDFLTNPVTHPWGSSSCCGQPWGAVAGPGGTRSIPLACRDGTESTRPVPAIREQLSFPGRIGASQPHVWLGNLPCERRAWKKPRRSRLKCQKHGNAGENPGCCLGAAGSQGFPKGCSPWSSSDAALEQPQQLPLAFLSSTGTGFCFQSSVLRKAAAENSAGPDSGQLRMGLEMREPGETSWLPVCRGNLLPPSFARLEGGSRAVFSFPSAHSQAKGCT